MSEDNKKEVKAYRVFEYSLTIQPARNLEQDRSSIGFYIHVQYSHVPWIDLLRRVRDASVILKSREHTKPRSKQLLSFFQPYPVYLFIAALTTNFVLAMLFATSECCPSFRLWSVHESVEKTKYSTNDKLAFRKYPQIAPMLSPLYSNNTSQC